MPRHGRRDALGALHREIVGGIARDRIAADRAAFVARHIGVSIPGMAKALSRELQ